MFGVYFNAGECCNSGSPDHRPEDIAEEVIGGRRGAVAQGRLRRPARTTATKVGAIVSPEHLGKIDGYVDGRGRGGRRRCGSAARRSTCRGSAASSTSRRCVAGVTPDMAIAREEVFGPVLSVLTFDTLDEAIDACQRRRLRPVGRSLEREYPYLPRRSRAARGPERSGPTPGWTASPSCRSAA